MVFTQVAAFGQGVDGYGFVAMVVDVLEYGFDPVVDLLMQRLGFEQETRQQLPENSAVFHLAGFGVLLEAGDVFGGQAAFVLQSRVVLQDFATGVDGDQPADDLHVVGLGFYFDRKSIPVKEPLTFAGLFVQMDIIQLQYSVAGVAVRYVGRGEVEVAGFHFVNLIAVNQPGIAAFYVMEPCKRTADVAEIPVGMMKSKAGVQNNKFFIYRILNHGANLIQMSILCNNSSISNKRIISLIEYLCRRFQEGSPGGVAR